MNIYAYLYVLLPGILSPINSYYHIIQDGETPLHYAVLTISYKGHLEVALLLLNKGADPNAKDRSGRTPGQVAGTRVNYYGASKDSGKTIQVFLERWPVLMTILMLRELSVFHLGNIDLAMMDLFEFIGQEKDFV